MSYMNKIIASSKPSAMKMVRQVTKAASKAKEIDQAYRKETADAKKDPEYLKMMADKPSPTKFTSKAVYHGYNDRKDPPVRSGDKSSPAKKKGPCWTDYEMVGMKKKGGRTVPNCVPKKKK